MPPEVQMFDSEKLASALRERRGERTMQDAADDSGIPRSCYNRMEKGYGSPSVENLLRACNWLGRSVDDFRQPARATAA